MRRDDQSVLALDSVHEVAQRGNGGVGAGGDGCHNANGVCNLHDAQFGDLFDDTNGLLILQIIIEHGGGIGVLADLVLDDFRNSRFRYILFIFNSSFSFGC